MLTLPAPAKLNLFLHITGRREDGYHNLETVFQLLDYGDELRFCVDGITNLRLSCSQPSLANEDNLVLKAARLLTPFAKQAAYCHIHLEKRLPLGSGLGGGSSDAATTLLALNKLWHCDLNTTQLAELGLQLGADVPVFVHGHSAFASGVGENLENQPLPKLWYLVLTPSCAVSTKEIFSHPELTRSSASRTMRAFPFPGSRNDCQAVSCQLYPAINVVLSWLITATESCHVVQAPRMTGTGSSVFASFSCQEHAQAVLTRLTTERSEFDPSCRGFIAQGVNISPLLTALNWQDEKGMSKE